MDTELFKVMFGTGTDRAMSAFASAKADNERKKGEIVTQLTTALINGEQYDQAQISQITSLLSTI